MSILIDSDVLIWFTRGHAAAADRLRQLDHWRISTITYMELVQGCRNKQELEQVKKGLALCQTEIIPLTPTVSQRAMDLIDASAIVTGVMGMSFASFPRARRQFVSRSLIRRGATCAENTISRNLAKIRTQHS